MFFLFVLYCIFALEGSSEVEDFEWNGQAAVKGAVLRDMTAKIIATKYPNNLPRSGHYLALRTYRDVLSQHIKRKGYLEECEELMSIWIQTITSDGNEDDIFVDGGANIGACSMYFASSGVHTLAFEPLPSNLHYFTKAVLFNRDAGNNLARLRLFQVALGDTERPETKILYTQQDNAGNSMLGNYVMDTDSRLSPGKMKECNVTITAVSFDYLARSTGYLNVIDNKTKMKKSPRRIRLLKLDVQGSELSVLRGMAQTLAEEAVKPKYIYSEVDPLRLEAMGASAKAFCDYLASHGYVLNNSNESWDNLLARLEDKAKVKGTLATENILARLETAKPVHMS
jgi:FkbM family methyltransferase